MAVFFRTYYLNTLKTKFLTSFPTKHVAVASKFYNTQDCKKTSLYDFHVKNGGKMVPFAGYMMPVQYAGQSITTSHIHTRNKVSLFDVSHMLQTKLVGKDQMRFIESITPADVHGLQDGQGTLSVLTNDNGGIIDDLIIAKTHDGYLYIVSNAACKDKDLAHIQSKLSEFKSKGGDVALEILDDRSLLAVQGPCAATVIQPLVSQDLKSLPFMYGIKMSVCGVPDCRVTRCGYTGEDGFELSVSNDKIVEVAETLLNSKESFVSLAGLGARDSLRLEAGLCLYGNDLDETTTPIEASLTWLVAKRRRVEAGFPGAEKIISQIKNKPTRRRIGFVIPQGPPARAHTKILNVSGSHIGEVTSGCPSPTLKCGIAMGYVTNDHTKVGTTVQMEIRNKTVEAIVTKLPFVPHKYANVKK